MLDRIAKILEGLEISKTGEPIVKNDAICQSMLNLILDEQEKMVNMFQERIEEIVNIRVTRLIDTVVTIRVREAVKCTIEQEIKNKCIKINVNVEGF